MTQLMEAPIRSGNGQRASALSAMAQRLNVEPDKLTKALTNTVFKNATNEEMLALVVVANQYGLNPFLKQLYAFPAKGGGIVPVVSIDGWICIVNSHETFDGCEFEFTNDQAHQPVSVLCRMHVKGRSHPVEVTEYFGECQRNTEPWKTMPRRMLRHKAYIQCARYAFGLGGVYDEDEARDMVDATVVSARDAEEPQQPRQSRAASMAKQLKGPDASAPASQQTAVHSLPADESTPSGHPSTRPADTATDSSVGSREAESDDHQQPEAPAKDEQPAPKGDDSQDTDSVTDESIDELVQQGEAQFKKALLAKARSLDGAVSKTSCEGGVFKFTTANGKGAEQWRRLWRAVAGGRFDFGRGVIL